jgi:hypothetical protein
MGDIGTIITSISHTKFLGLTWKRLIEEVIKKLTMACYMIRNIKPAMPMKTLISIYHSYFHCVMPYGLMFWGTSTHAERVFKLQKTVIRLIKVVVIERHVENTLGI